MDHHHRSDARPADFGFSDAGDEVLNRFQVRLLTEGSGTQIFSTTFTQWAAREASRRGATTHTMLVRFAPRQRQRSMNELLSGHLGDEELDPAGSLIDADMGAYYTWLNQQRLERSRLPFWFGLKIIMRNWPLGLRYRAEQNQQQQQRTSENCLPG